MEESARLELKLFCRRSYTPSEECERCDEDLSCDDMLTAKIRKQLNHPEINKDCLVDAYYYDYGCLPEEYQDKFSRDMYLIYGITTKGKMISKWIERWDLQWTDIQRKDKPPKTSGTK